MLRHHIFSDRLGRYTGVPMTGKRGRPRNLPHLSLHTRTSTCAKTDRDKNLVIFFLEGRTLQETGDKFGITRERARQILEKNDIRVRGLGKKIKPPRPPKKTDVDKFWSFVDKTPGHGPSGDCWIWTKRANKHPYGRMRFRGKLRGAHVISWMLAERKLGPKQWILHRCDFPICVNPNHLYSGTPKDNANDRENRGRSKRSIPRAEIPRVNAMFAEGLSVDAVAEVFGITKSTARRLRRLAGFGGFRGFRRKLSAEDASDIRRALKRGETLRSQAIKYGVGHTAIWRIKAGITYKEEKQNA